ncbi:hypothetical protein ABIE21_000029 [Conyzicola nivalis]|uniref:Uncharacterized protein n=1 Tax=Conyzicola nivalis TaxID=1477021 RepID=A0ABV2QHL9_9MICO
MSNTRVRPSLKTLTLIAVAYSAVIIALGVWVSVSTGEWLALVCALGLVVVPLGVVGRRKAL